MRRGTIDRWLGRIYRVFLYLMPVALVFSYYPVITLGENVTMNLELSLPLIWLIMFDVAGGILVIRRGKVGLIWQKWYYLLFPIFASLSILWSSNVLRGVLVGGIIWAIFVAIWEMVLLRDELSARERKMALRVFLIASVGMSIWCLLQCVLDLAGVGRENSLLCAGCVSGTFGFPHPNGFAVEPQFMGNLLLAPIVVTTLFVEGKSRYLLLLLFAGTLFLTFSRGAIYAMIVGLLFWTGWVLAQREERKKRLRCVGTIWFMIVLSFGLALNTQGIMAEVGPTSDTYGTAVAKALNHLSLGIIDVRGQDEGEGEAVESTSGNESEGEDAENASGDEDDVMKKTDAVFDGYVAESTEVRKVMTRNALQVWGANLHNVLFGVGLGGAGAAMYEADLIDSPKEIVQNQYVSLLAEVGIVGVGLLVTMAVVVVKNLLKNRVESEDAVAVIMVLTVMYGVSLVFFAGLPNVLHIYLMPAWLWSMFERR